MTPHRLVSLALVATLFACGGDAEDSGSPGGSSSWSGLWRQIGCADDAGVDAACPVSVDQLRRMIQFADGGGSAELWFEQEPDNVNVHPVRDDAICIDVFGDMRYYPLSLSSGRLLYCLTDDLCELLEEVP